MPLDPATATTTASRPISPLPQPHPHHHYPSPQQQQTLPSRAPNPPLAKPHDPSQPFAYPFAAFAPKGLRDHGVAAGYPPPSLMFPHAGVRGMNLDYLSHALHVTRPLPHVPFPHLGNNATITPAASPPVKKATPRSAVSDINGYKDTSVRERSREDTYVVVRDRKVRITEDASLYALCRSWLRNGIHEESQPQQKDVMKALPKPLPASMVGSYISNKKEDENGKEEQEENEKSVEHLSPQDLLKRHIKRAKKVRARLREERLQRIMRYRSRLRLLLPPPVEQFRNDTAAGN
ncbi:uncharacterized protein LOC113855310 [Abrus precatorius]|uniref:Uncharacterized protein LOC113855310 n=1 Tax=Abrus precatorius TaxID=3816 RepID=A0A8B8KIH5_ABRPR|nr:uncharacterized protein LOC113855310 [Abrus precatorius]XP_027342699.1 uncharacterized protein LOC113855310 [Abrus precatorius]